MVKPLKTMPHVLKVKFKRREKETIESCIKRMENVETETVIAN